MISNNQPYSAKAVSTRKSAEDKSKVAPMHKSKAAPASAYVLKPTTLGK